jgi:hypothetical protein
MMTLGRKIMIGAAAFILFVIVLAITAIYV